MRSRFMTIVKVKRRNILSDDGEPSRNREAMEIKTADRNDNFTLNDPFVMEISVPLKLRIKSR